MITPKFIRLTICNNQELTHAQSQRGSCGGKSLLWDFYHISPQPWDALIPSLSQTMKALSHLALFHRLWKPIPSWEGTPVRGEAAISICNLAGQPGKQDLPARQSCAFCAVCPAALQHSILKSSWSELSGAKPALPTGKENILPTNRTSHSFYLLTLF